MDGNNYLEMLKDFFEDIIRGLQSYSKDYWPGTKRFAGERTEQQWQPWGEFLRGVWGEIRESPRWPGLRLTPEPGNRPPGPASPMPTGLTMPPPPIFTGGPYRQEVETQFQYPTEPPPNAIPLTDEDYQELLRRMAGPQKPGFTQ